MHGRQRGIAVGISIGAAALVLLAAVIVFMRRDDKDVRVTGTSTTTTITRESSTTSSTTTTTSSTTTSATVAETTTTAAGPNPTGPPETVPDTTPGPGLTLADASVVLTPVAAISQPIAGSVWPGDPSSLYIASRTGYLFRVRGGVIGPLLDISNETTASGERGLLGIAFSPDGASLAVSYTNLNGDNQLDLFGVNGDGTINAGDRHTVMIVAHPTYANHNGGGVLYGPDGYIWWGLGDGGGGGDPFNNAQDLTTFRGKMVRIDPAGAASIAHWGLRNPWRFSFDRATGDLYIADVGQNAYEEVDWLPAGALGANFGWNLREGFHPYRGGAPPPGNVDPIFEYTHTDGRCSITGGYVYRGSRIPALNGAYLFSDFCGGQIHALMNEGGTVTLERDLGVNGGGVASFAEDAAGELYVLSFDGYVYRVDPA